MIVIPALLIVCIGVFCVLAFTIKWTTSHSSTTNLGSSPSFMPPTSGVYVAPSITTGTHPTICRKERSQACQHSTTH